MAQTQVRREGFVGQHLVVVPQPVRRAVAHHPLLEGLLVTDAGFFPEAEGHRVERPQGATTHLVIICLVGSGWAKSGSRMIALRPGDFIWLPADHPHAYGSDDSKPWSIVWAHFTGNEASHWLTELSAKNQSPPAFFEFGRHHATTLGLDKVYAELEAGYSFHQLVSASVALRAVFCTAMKLAQSPSAAKTATERTAAVRETLVAEPARAYRLNELASAAGLSIPHFCALFKKQTGYAPIDFIIRQRIRSGCRLLDTSAATISAIASDVGFSDPYYFSRCFHRVMGISPRTYRNTIKG